MDADDRVKHKETGRVGKALGHAKRFGVGWIEVEWEDGNIAYTSENVLEVINDKD